MFPGDVTEDYKHFKEQFPLDFRFDSIPAVNLIVDKLKNWINYIEKKFNYTSNFFHEYRCSKIHNIDWSVIKLPSDHFIEVMFFRNSCIT